MINRCHVHKTAHQNQPIPTSTSPSAGELPAWRNFSVPCLAHPTKSIQAREQWELGLPSDDGFSGKMLMSEPTDKRVDYKVIIKMLFIKTRLLAANGPGKAGHVFD